MKKIIAVSIILSVMLCMFGCTQGNNASENESETKSVSQTETEKPADGTSGTETEKPADGTSGTESDKAAESESGTEENILGEYYEGDSDGFTLRVSRSVPYPESCTITVFHMSEDRREETVWTFHGTDEGKSTISYTDCSKTVYIYDEEGRETHTVEYEDGTGNITIKGNTVTWQDDREDAGKDMVFTQAE